MMRPPPLGGTPVPLPADGTAELQHIADMIGWSMAVSGALSLILLGLVFWLVFGRGTSQAT